MKFFLLQEAGVVQTEAILQDSTVLEADILYPTDVNLVYQAFRKMQQFAKKKKYPLWWDHSEVKQLRRSYNLEKKADRMLYLQKLNEIFAPALEKLKEFIPQEEEEEETEVFLSKDQQFLALLLLFEKQTQLKLEGVIHIPDRIVSLDDPDARPIKKGKKYPSCEFGSTEQFCFNRRGFMITCAIYLGKCNDKTLYQETLDEVIKKIHKKPKISVTDGGYRSQANRKYLGLDVVFMGKSSDVEEKYQEFCRKARSATEGFIAVAKNCRGFRRSRYWGIEGHRIWSKFCQIAYNLKKFLQLYENEEIEEQVLIKLGLLEK